MDVGFEMRERIDGISYNLETETEEVLTQLRAYRIAAHAQAGADIERIDRELMRRHQAAFEFDASVNYENVIGQALEAGEITAEEAIEALDRFES